MNLRNFYANYIGLKKLNELEEAVCLFSINSN